MNIEICMHMHLTLHHLVSSCPVKGVFKVVDMYESSVQGGRNLKAMGEISSTATGLKLTLGLLLLELDRLLPADFKQY